MKVTIATFYFCHSKNPSDIMKNTFNSISIYSWKKISSLTTIRNKCVIRKKYLYYWSHEKWPYFFFIFNMITDSFLVEKWETLERARRYVWKSLSNLDCLDGICFAFFKLFKNGELFGESFSFPIFCKMSSKKLQIFISNFF